MLIFYQVGKGGAFGGTDLTSHCARQFKMQLSPNCKIGHTLFHVTKCIQENFKKNKDLNNCSGMIR